MVRLAVGSAYPEAQADATDDNVARYVDPDAPASSPVAESKSVDEAEGAAAGGGGGGGEAAVGPRPAPFFYGYPRPGDRGVGTRNFLLVIPVSATCGAVARTVARRTRAEARRVGGPSVDGVIALEHTENAGTAAPHNLDFVRRALAGFAVHPNAAAALVLSADDETEALSGAALRAWMREQGYPLEHCTMAFQSTRGLGFREAVDAGVRQVLEWVPGAAACRRERRPVSELRLALQCGGSDAFSGVSGNPLAGQVAREVVRRGGSAVLAETDELITAEAWVLQSVRDAAVAERFVGKVQTFRRRLAAHGQTAEANPSGGNLWRGLTGISLKSLGAGMKKPSDVRLDGVLDYAQRLPAPGGYMFMDSPGNDLESLAGQVATGATVVTFTSGNGSVAGNSFVPVIKIVTTTRRFRKLRGDMDVNAGLLLDGVPMRLLKRAAFKQLLGVASGRRTAGERAGHYQMQIWRDWPIEEGGEGEGKAGEGPSAFERAVGQLSVEPGRLGRPAGDAGILVHADSEHAAAAAAGGGAGSGGSTAAAPTYRGRRQTGPGAFRWRGASRERVGLVVPTSLCSAQTASMVAARLNLELQGAGAGSVALKDEAGLGAAGGEEEDEAGEGVDAALRGFDRFVALPHTEGCGSGGPQEQYYRTVAGHGTHPAVASTLFVEHGCEMAHNDNVRREMRGIAGEEALWTARVGWASVQQDGGVEAVSAIARKWFAGQGAGEGGEEEAPVTAQVLGLHVDAALDAPQRAQVRELVRRWVGWGGAVVVPESCPMLAPGAGATLRFAEAPAGCGEGGGGGPAGVAPGVYVMRCPTSQWTEVLTGLGAAGCGVLVGVSGRSTVQGHPLVPTVLCAPSVESNPDADVVLRADEAGEDGGLTEAVRAVVAREWVPRNLKQGNTAWQITRGQVCVSV